MLPFFDNHRNAIPTFGAMSAKLKIGFDAKRVYQNFTGLGNFSRTLLQDFNHYAPNLELHLFAPRNITNERTAIFSRKPFQNHFPKTRFKNWWRSRGIVKDLQKEKIDIYHGLSHEIPLGIEKSGIPSVLSMHDLIIKADPKQFNWLDRKIYNAKFLSSCKRADKIVAISESTKNDIIKYYGIPEEKINVIYQTCHQQFKTPVNKNDLLEYAKTKKLPKEYLLYVGAAIPRKNLFGLVEALSQLPEDLQIPLLVVAGSSSYRKKVERYVEANRLNDLVVFLDNCPFNELPLLYAGAKAMCYPSSYEGFGLPVVESLFCRTPVLTTRNSSLPEAGGPGALYIDSPSSAKIKEGLIRILEDGSLRKKLSEEGYRYVQKFQSDKIIAEWNDLYEHLYRKKNIDS